MATSTDIPPLKQMEAVVSEALTTARSAKEYCKHSMTQLDACMVRLDKLGTLISEAHYQPAENNAAAILDAVAKVMEQHTKLVAEHSQEDGESDVVPWWRQLKNVPLLKTCYSCSNDFDPLEQGWQDDSDDWYCCVQCLYDTQGEDYSPSFPDFLRSQGMHQYPSGNYPTTDSIINHCGGASGWTDLWMSEAKYSSIDLDKYGASVARAA